MVAAATYPLSSGVPARILRLHSSSTIDGTLKLLGYKVSSPEGEGETPAVTYPRNHATMDVGFVFKDDLRKRRSLLQAVP